MGINWGGIPTDDSSRGSPRGGDLPPPETAVRAETLRKAKEALHFEEWTPVDSGVELTGVLAAKPDSGIEDYHTVLSESSKGFVDAVYNAVELKATGLVVACGNVKDPERAAYFKFRQSRSSDIYPGMLCLEYSGQPAFPIKFDHFKSALEALRDIDGYTVALRPVVVGQVPRA